MTNKMMLQKMFLKKRQNDEPSSKTRAKLLPFDAIFTDFSVYIGAFSCITNVH